MEVQDRQTLVDMALVATGSVEGVVALAVRNGVSPTEPLQVGLQLNTHPEDIVDSNIVSRYAIAGIAPATQETE